MAGENKRIGVVGAGTMGSGIALLALVSGYQAVLYDLDAQQLAVAEAYIEKHLARKGQQAYRQRLILSERLEDLSPASTVIEAVIEDLEVKREIFARLDDVCPPPALLATNTSTLSVSAIARAASHPGRVAGMHFFNPAPVLPLVEIVRGADTTTGTVQKLQSLARAWGKTPVVAGDRPGFIVNRVARPFYGEALRLLSEGVADHATLDMLVENGGGFRMGPFRLMDLIGLDVNLAAMQSMYHQTFGEPRYRPHWIQAQMVAQGRLGRKSGRGFYQYQEEGLNNRPTIEPVDPAQTGWWVVSSGEWAPGVTELMRQRGHQVSGLEVSESRPVGGLVLAGREADLPNLVARFDRFLPPEVPLLCQLADITLAELAGWVARPDRLVGFDGLFLASGRVATLVPSPTLSDSIRQAVERLVSSLGRTPVWITDTPALVLPRLVAMLANEAAQAVLEGVAEASVVDLAMRLGVNYPQGPLAWAQQLGLGRIVAVLEHLHREYGEARYRISPQLRHWSRWTRHLPPLPSISPEGEEYP